MALSTSSRSVGELAARQRTRHGATDRVYTDQLLDAAGHQVHIRPLRAAVGGLEACVVPLADGTFRFICDDAASPGEPDDVACLEEPRQFRISFRLAHELAHTVLGRMSFGARRDGHSFSATEARCDEFATLFLVGPQDALAALHAGELAIEALARGLNVPDRLVREAAATA